MSFTFATDLPPSDPSFRSVSGLANGFGPNLAALLVAAYACAGESDSRRVGRWLRLRRVRYGTFTAAEAHAFSQAARDAGLGYDGPRSPAQIRALMEFEHEGALWYELDVTQMERGLKLKPVATPLAVQLVEAVRELTSPSDYYGVLQASATASLAELDSELRGPLGGALPRGVTAEVADVLHVAARSGVGVRYG